MQNRRRTEISPERSTLAGFTLIELLISISIIGIITALVVVKFSAFDSSVLLKNGAYEIALTLRDAQVYSISVHGDNETNPDFNYPYGLHFTRGDTYIFFRDKNTSAGGIPVFNSTGDDAVKMLKLSSSMVISDICVDTSVTSDNCTPGTLDISFRRPEFKALFHTDTVNSGINNAKIKLRSTTNPSASTWIVEVGLLGHISVYKQ